MNLHETQISEKTGQNQTLIPLALPWLTLASKLSTCSEFTSLTKICCSFNRWLWFEPKTKLMSAKTLGSTAGVEPNCHRYCWGPLFYQLFDAFRVAQPREIYFSALIWYVMVRAAKKWLRSAKPLRFHTGCGTHRC